jgi:hypothetical protein
LDEIDIEQLYRTIDDALDLHFRSDPLLHAPIVVASRGLERLHYEIKRCILRHCLIEEASRASYLAPLATELRGAAAPLPIVSLNYDTLVELFCQLHGVKCFDPVVDQFGTSSGV